MVSLYKRYMELRGWETLLSASEAAELEILTLWYYKKISSASCRRRLRVMKAIGAVV